MKENNNNTPNRSLRIVSYLGRYTVKWVVEDSDGDVDYILRDDGIDFKERNLNDLKRLIKKVGLAIDKPVIIVNSANKDIYFKEE